MLFLLKGEKFMVSGRHKWYLPAAKCRKCGGGVGGWGDQGLAYPHVEIPSALPRSEYRVRSPVPWTVYEELKRPLRRIAPSELPLPPGTDFGPLVGTMSGPATDFAWVWDWECLVRSDALARLQDHLGARIQTAQAEISSRRKEKPVYFELVALPSALLAESSELQLPHFRCSACGEYFASGDYNAYAEPPGVVIRVRRSSIPQEAHVFRIRQLSTWVLCSDLFRQAVLDLELQNIRFLPVEVADE